MSSQAWRVSDGPDPQLTDEVRRLQLGMAHTFLNVCLGCNENPQVDFKPLFERSIKDGYKKQRYKEAKKQTVFMKTHRAFWERKGASFGDYFCQECLYSFSFPKSPKTLRQIPKAKVCTIIPKYCMQKRP